MNKKLAVPALALTLAGALALGAAAAGTALVTAEHRPDITVKMGGQIQTLKNEKGDTVYPLVYDGTTYLPIRALGQVLDYNVSWDGGSQTVSLNAKGALPTASTLAEAEARMTALEQEISSLKPGNDYSQRARQYAEAQARLEKLDDDLDAIVREITEDFRTGTIGYETYQSRMGRADAVDVRLDDAQRRLEEKTIADDAGRLTAEQQAERQISALEQRTDALERQVRDLVGADSYAGRVKQYYAVDDVLSPLSDDVSAALRALNDDLKAERLTYSQYNPLSQRLGALDVRLKDARMSLEKKTISIEDSQKPSRPVDGGAYGAYTTKLDALEQRVNEQAAAVDGDRNRQQAAQLLRRIDALDEELDDLDDALERDYHAGTLTGEQYRALEHRLDRLDDALERAEDRLDDWAESRWGDDWDDD